MHALPEMFVTGVKAEQIPTGFRVRASSNYNECENDNCGGGFGDCSDCGDDCKDDCACSGD